MSLVDKAKASIKKDRIPLSIDRIIGLLRKRRHTTKELCQALKASEAEVLCLIEEMQGKNVLIYLFGSEWGIDSEPSGSLSHTYVSRSDGTYLFGFVSDQHLASKYSRLDCLNDLYDQFEAQGVDRAICPGNYVDGEAKFNQHDILVHGMDPQIKYLADNHPHKPGIVTYAISGDDHEGWWGQREGIDIGKHTEQVMRDCGRKDWVNLGYMESFIELKHAKSGKSCQLLVMHPGGGSAYAYSYKPQKIVESLDGGEKPAVLLIGHYHKLSYNVVRNVHVAQCGTLQDQTPFMRKKGLQAHVGGGICQLKQDCDTGAITACRIEFFNYFNAGHYSGRWSHGGSVALPKRSRK